MCDALSSRQCIELQYEPLRTDQIRVLHLVLEETTHLVGWLKVVELGDADFIAISYVWGDEDAARPMLLMNEAIPVRNNLDAALRGMRSHAQQLNERRADSMVAHLWVDAL